MHNRLDEMAHAIRRYYPREFESLMREIEYGQRERARQLLRSMSTFIEEGYSEALIQHLATQMEASSTSAREALRDNPDALRILLRSGNKSEAIEFYHERTGEDWQACLHFINALEKNLEAEAAAAQEAQYTGADSAVLFFLLKAGHLDDAVRYCCLRAESTPETARAMLEAMQQEIERGDRKLPDATKRPPDPETLRFLLQAGHEMIAIRYYRDCTEASMVEAKRVIASMRQA